MAHTQEPPTLGNQYEDDRVLRSYLKRVMPATVLRDVEDELREMGKLAGGFLYALQQSDRIHEPTLTSWDAWGTRIDRVEVTRGWREAERLAAQRGLVAAAYEQKHGIHSRIHQFALVHLFAPSTDFYCCPLAMTDGAARTLLAAGNNSLILDALPHLTSRNPAHFWTSGQWMTERVGGSDVSQTETTARQDEKGTWRLYGHKWFTSSVSAQIALTLARPEGGPPGSKGLALFYVELRDPQGRLCNIRVERLKDKLGTRKLPTAELTLDGTPAMLVSSPGQGVKSLAPMLNVTRTWNAVCAVALMRRGLALARSYARKRTVFGAYLSDKPLHAETMAGMQAVYEGAFHLAFRVVEAMGEAEVQDFAEGEGRHAHPLLRVLTPLAKLTTGKQVVAVASEVLEAFGGAGYVEDTGLPALLRDAQVLPVWEGTTNVLALDVLRALHSVGGLEVIQAEIRRCAETVRDTPLLEVVRRAAQAVDAGGAWLSQASLQGEAVVEAGARHFAWVLGRALELALLARHAQWALDHEHDARPAAAARRLAAMPLVLPPVDLGASFALANDTPFPHASIPTSAEVMVPDVRPKEWGDGAT